MSKQSLNKLYGCFALMLLLCFWEMVSRYYEYMDFVLPAPSKIALTLWEYRDRFFFHFMATLQETAGGFLLAFAAAFPLAWLMSLFGPLRLFLQPFFVAIQCVPMFALAPIMVLWFGWSYMAVVVPTALMIFFPLTISIYQGLCSTPITLLEFFHLHEATAWQTFFKLQLPWAVPHIFAGLRIAVAFAGIGAVAGEWAGAQAGLGVLMLESRRAADIEMIFGALACVTAVSITFYFVTTRIEKWMKQRHRRGLGIGQAVSCIIVAASVLTGCQQVAGDPKEVRFMLDWLPNPNHVPLYCGIEHGFFKEEGINLKILKIADPSDGIPYLSSGQADLCLTYMPHTLKAMLRGAKVTPIGILIKEPLNGLIYRKDGRITNLEDLNGKVLGYCVDGHQTKFLQAMLDSKDIIPKELRNVSFDLIGPLATKQVDAVYGAYWNIEGESLRFLGFDTDYFPLSDFDVPQYYELIILAKQNGPYDKDDFIAAFQRGLQKSIEYALNNPEEAFDSYLKSNPDKGTRTKAWEREAWLKTIPFFADQQQIDSTIWNQFIEWLIKHNLLPQDKPLPFR